MIEQRQRALSNSQQTRTGEEQKSVINKLFGIMRLAYPSFLAGKEDAEVAATKRLWLSHLKDYREDAISECADMMVSEFPARAPTVGQFKRLLDDIKGRKPTDRTPNDGWCDTCHSYTFTQHHKDVCVLGVKFLANVTPEEVEKVKKLYGKLR